MDAQFPMVQAHGLTDAKGYRLMDRQTPAPGSSKKHWAIIHHPSRPKNDTGHPNTISFVPKKRPWASTKHYPRLENDPGYPQNTFPVSKTILGNHKTLSPSLKRSWASTKHFPPRDKIYEEKTPFKIFKIPTIRGLWFKKNRRNVWRFFFEF